MKNIIQGISRGWSRKFHFSSTYDREDLIQEGWKLYLEKPNLNKFQFITALQNRFKNILSYELRRVNIIIEDYNSVANIESDPDELFMLEASMFFSFLKELGEDQALEVCMKALEVKNENPKIQDVMPLLGYSRSKMGYNLKRIRKLYQEFKEVA
jgi:hypothetical protein